LSAYPNTQQKPRACNQRKRTAVGCGNNPPYPELIAWNRLRLLRYLNPRVIIGKTESWTLCDDVGNRSAGNVV
jgi:hypothetical protein